jgi:hypothetical protein
MGQMGPTQQCFKFKAEVALPVPGCPFCVGGAVQVAVLTRDGDGEHAARKYRLLK